MVLGLRTCRKMSARLSETLKSAAQQLPPIESSEFGAKFDDFGNSRLVLIGDGRL
ncbi:hypothetical protein GGS26DRAFT_564301, partial [Hypomontagnella submonticulosa]